MSHPISSQYKRLRKHVSPQLEGIFIDVGQERLNSPQYMQHNQIEKCLPQGTMLPTNEVSEVRWLPALHKYSFTKEKEGPFVDCVDQLAVLIGYCQAEGGTPMVIEGRLFFHYYGENLLKKHCLKTLNMQLRQ